MSRAVDAAERGRLVLPYGVIGLTGGWMAADFFRAGAFSIDAGFRPLLVVMTPLVGASLGLVLDMRGAATSRARATLLLAAVVLAAGALTGALVGCLLWPPQGLFVGAGYGLLCGLVFVPPFAMVAAAARSIGRARPGSLVDASDRRSVWLATATAVALGEVAALPDWPRYGMGWAPSPAVSLALGAFALAAVAGVLICDIASLARVHRVAGEATVMRPRGRDTALPAFPSRHLDVGIGDQQLEQVVPAGVVYRDVDRVLQVVRGDPFQARRALAWAVGRGALALTVSLGVVVALFAGKIGPG